ncbi:hypothetical protein [Vitiosangium sp. GDMCC 1.1324]|uniref:hypothetical protein n=1 Tax=Vitiosangium sp. (strain GDMCC 1.1324) TaxID=2138576 RepID=UPI000D380726|nr:hypothetical protein [Vitiosangium sp. GDMCC 1.1324]PTL83600.1 hypothetical protein DAT35_08915 [Vitiosangium sp. GDMCC 1.1324]
MQTLARYACVFALLVLCGCGGRREYRIPPGATGTLPSGAGYPCKPGWWSGDTIEITAHVSGASFRAKQLGSATVHCPKSTITFVVEELTRLEISGPDSVAVDELPEPEYRLQAYGPSGQEIDLGVLSSPDIAWNAPASFRLRQPSCGHMAAICSGFIGNGELMRADPQEPGIVVLEARVQGRTASRTITVKPKAE